MPSKCLGRLRWRSLAARFVQGANCFFLFACIFGMERGVSKVQHRAVNSLPSVKKGRQALRKHFLKAWEVAEEARGSAKASNKRTYARTHTPYRTHTRACSLFHKCVRTSVARAHAATATITARTSNSHNALNVDMAQLKSLRQACSGLLHVA